MTAAALVGWGLSSIDFFRSANRRGGGGSGGNGGAAVTVVGGCGFVVTTEFVRLDIWESVEIIELVKSFDLLLLLFWLAAMIG